MVLELLFPYISANIPDKTGTLAQSFTYARKVTMGARKASPHNITNISNYRPLVITNLEPVCPHNHIITKLYSTAGVDVGYVVCGIEIDP